MAIIVALYGIYAFVKKQMAGYMFLRNQFVFFDFDEPVIFILMDYMAAVEFFSVMGYYISKLLHKEVHKNNTRKKKDINRADGKGR